MSCFNSKDDCYGIIDKLFREILRLEDVVKWQHHIIDYLENRLYCALIDADSEEE